MNKIEKLRHEFPQTYAEELGINLEGGDFNEIFKWFLASFLFGKRISENLAKRTYKEFERENLLSPEAISKAGWDKLVEVLDRGGYARYDFSTASRLLELMHELKEKGGLERIFQKSRDAKDLENRLKEFKGFGSVTANIFPRELRFMPKADPEISRFVRISARNLGINLTVNRKTKDFIRLESALLRLGKDYCRKNKCKICKLREYCKRK